jgi:hypothetical protein
MSQKQNCDCSKIELIQEKLDSCKQSKQESCETEKNQLKTDLESTRKKLVMFQIMCAICIAILGKEGASEAIDYFTKVDTIEVQPSFVKETNGNEDDSNDAYGPFRE